MKVSIIKYCVQERMILLLPASCNMCTHVIGCEWSPVRNKILGYNRWINNTTSISCHEEGTWSQWLKDLAGNPLQTLSMCPKTPMQDKFTCKRALAMHFLVSSCNQWAKPQNFFVARCSGLKVKTAKPVRSIHGGSKPQGKAITAGTSPWTADHWWLVECYYTSLLQMLARQLCCWFRF